MSRHGELTDDELDLSLRKLTEVPLDKLKIPKFGPGFISVDLSCNNISELSWAFTQLTHLVKIDLSENLLRGLPDTFGDLVNLKHLDLYNNYLEDLPVSFCKLQKLKWLDLKYNPLKPALLAVAGQCATPQDCQTCAKKIVLHMESVQYQKEIEERRRFEACKAKKAAEIAEEGEIDEERRLKKLERKRRKAEIKAKKAQLLQDDLYEQNVTPEIYEKETSSKNTYAPGYFTKFVVYTIFSICFIYIICLLNDVPIESISTADVASFFEKWLLIMRSSLVKFAQMSVNYIPTIRETCLDIILYSMNCITNVASELETFLSHYF